LPASLSAGTPTATFGRPIARSATLYTPPPHQKRANAHTARVGIDRRVVDARPSAIVTGKNRSNNPSAIVLGYETGVGIAFEERFYRILGIVDVPHGETGASRPQPVYQRIIFNFHTTDGWCRPSHISSFSR